MPAARTEDGYSLIETLMTVIVMGLVFVGILGAMGTLWVGSDVHRKQADANTLLISASERLKSRDVPFVPCVAGASGGVINPAAPPASLAPYTAAVQSVTPPGPGWTVRIAQVTYEFGSIGSGNFDSTKCYDSADLHGQQITIEVASPNGKSVQRLAIVKGNN
jgi:type II secretory pathway pseudopilin PulG